MKTLHFAIYLGTLSLGLSHAVADQTAATITQSSDKITRSMSANGVGESAGAGTALHSGEFVKTGKTALAELVLANKTVTRLGPNTVIAYTAASHEATVNAGTLLFSKPKDGEAMTFQLGTVTASVTGTTGFVERTGDSVYLGIIEGTVQVTVGTAKTLLHAGNMLVAHGKTGQVVSFDVPHFVSSSAFFHRFARTLPNEPAIEHEIASYQDKVARGFIASATLVPLSADHRESMAAAHTSGREMAGSAINTALASRSVGSVQRVAAASIGGDPSSASLTLSGGSLAVNGYSGSSVNTTGGTILGGGSLSVNGPGSGALSTSGGSISAITVNSGYSGTLNLNGGNTLIVGGNTYQVTGVSTVTIGNGVVTGINTTGTLNVNGATVTGASPGAAGTIALTGGTLTGTAGGNVFTGTGSTGFTITSGASNLSGNTGTVITTGPITTGTVTTTGTH